ncbi:hypothetical protein [Bacteroides heparinolyticus]|uniref:hypothetical protein n=1 Tax=Prevotella heparinolytica TaxID=28113 RepID=UPI0035A1A61F
MKIELTDEAVKLLDEERLKRNYSLVDGAVLHKLGEVFDDDVPFKERVLRYIVFKLLKDTWSQRSESGERGENNAVESALEDTRVIES